MRFRVVFTEQSEREFLSLPNNIQKLIKKAIKDRLEIDPLSYGKPLRFAWKGFRSLRVSNYRLIYEVDHTEIIVTIVKADIRRDVYEK